MYYKIGGILNTVNGRKPKKVSMLVMRFTKNGLTGNARPCYHCLKMMKEIGIEKIYYSTGCKQIIICEFVKDMISFQISSVTRQIHLLNFPHENNIIFFENLIKNKFPISIKKKNLIYFLEYNLNFILPDCNYSITKNEIIFYNQNNQKIIKSIII